MVERSHPLRVRGLKRFWAGGATPTNGSHPLRVRGLKPYKFAIIDYFEKSHPLRVRGLKLTLDKSVKNTF